MTTPAPDPTATTTPAPARGRRLAIVVLATVAIAGAAMSSAARGEKGRVLPAPAVDEPAASTPQVAVFAGGCFWGVQGVFQHVKGVTSAVSGYAGGAKNTADYESVGSGRTGHAESVRVTYDPRQVSYGRLLQVYFSVAHDPTELNRQGPDTGTQYRSTIFPGNEGQTRVARAYIAQLNAASVFGRRIATTIETEQPFFAAEDYHQDYLTLNPRAPYIVINDLPKIGELKRLFPELYRNEPVLVSSSR